MSTRCAVLALASFLLPSVYAAPIGTYIFTGIASGSVGNTTFTDATLTLTATGDVSTITTRALGPTFLLDLLGGVATFSISGVGTGTFMDATYVFDNQSAFGGSAGFGDGSDIIQVHDDDLGLTVFSTYDLKSSIGPIGFVTNPSVSDWVNLPTSLGPFTVTSESRTSFQAIVGVVPEPSTLLLVFPVLYFLCRAGRGTPRKQAEGSR